uniref:HDC19048 n=1 Tax=Drosophila melanogaster TaxID=7227 RepID=Q6IIC1_DROME|nr:TPA_inf: HDC19048 [Drosophila melanogaster]
MHTRIHDAIETAATGGTANSIPVSTGLRPRKTLIRHVGARRSVDVARTAANNNSSHGRHTGPRPRLGLRLVPQPHSTTTATNNTTTTTTTPKPPTPAAAIVRQNTATTTTISRHNNNNNDDCWNNNVQQQKHQGKLKNSVELERNKNIKKMSEAFEFWVTDVVIAVAIAIAIVIVIVFRRQRRQCLMFMYVCDSMWRLYGYMEHTYRPRPSCTEAKERHFQRSNAPALREKRNENVV